ncbi:MAG: DUF975 family protein [Clostridiales bacterium]|jgi:uncharacterized membrane protein|nr:DUF975 family protein [Clostridiales bacterium]
MNDNIIVTLTCSNLRRWGRQALSGHWAPAVLATALFMLLSVFPILVLTLYFDSDVVSFMSNIYGVIINGPLTLGYTVFILAIFRRRETTPAEVFYGFEHFGKAFGLFIVVNVLVLLWSLLFIIPGIIASYRYGMAFFILADNPNIGIMDAIEESKRLMDGNKMKLFCLDLSFIGWALLSVMTFGIGFLWLMPYMYASRVGFYEVVNGNLRPRIRQDESNGITLS